MTRDALDGQGADRLRRCRRRHRATTRVATRWSSGSTEAGLRRRRPPRRRRRCRAASPPRCASSPTASPGSSSRPAAPASARATSRPKGTRAVIEREAPGLAEAIRRVSDADGRGFGMLSRAVAGTRGRGADLQPAGLRERRGRRPRRDAARRPARARPPRRRPPPLTSTSFGDNRRPERSPNVAETSWRFARAPRPRCRRCRPAGSCRPRGAGRRARAAPRRCGSTGRTCRRRRRGRSGTGAAGATGTARARARAGTSSAPRRSGPGAPPSRCANARWKKLSRTRRAHLGRPGARTPRPTPPPSRRDHARSPGAEGVPERFLDRVPGEQRQAERRGERARRSCVFPLPGRPDTTTYMPAAVCPSAGIERVAKFERVAYARHWPCGFDRSVSTDDHDNRTTSPRGWVKVPTGGDHEPGATRRSGSPRTHGRQSCADQVRVLGRR